MMRLGGDWWAVAALVMVACMVLMGWMMMGHGSHRGRRGESGHGSQGGSEHRSDSPTAREILAERFARGEISEDEFTKRKRVLERQV